MEQSKLPPAIEGSKPAQAGLCNPLGLEPEQWLELICTSWEKPEALPHGIRLPRFPSQELQLSTTGHSGRETLQNAFHFYLGCTRAFDRLGNPLNESSRLLDFACGWGRIGRFFLRDVRANQLFGSDITESLVAICQETFQNANFVTNSAYPPTGFSSGFFSHIVGYSIFSHLSEPAAREWIAEFWRLLSSGGTLVLTTRNGAFLDYCESLRGIASGGYQKALAELVPDFAVAREKYNAGQFVHASSLGISGGGRLSSEFYGESFIPETYAAAEYADHFELVEFLPKLHDPCQAVMVFSKKG